MSMSRILSPSAANRRPSPCAPQVRDGEQDFMQRLTAQWYNALTTGLSLDPQAFQLVQGSQSLGSTSETLWNTLDAVPIKSVVSAYNPNPVSRFSQLYRGVIYTLKPPGQADFANAMGEAINAWKDYLNSNHRPPGTSPVAWFRAWAQSNLADPGQVTAAVQAYREELDGPVGEAGAMLDAFDVTQGDKYVFDGSIKDLKNQLLGAPPRSVTMDSSSTSSDLSHTWANGAAEGVFDDFFSIGGSSSYDSLVSTLSQAALRISATFQRVLTYAAPPLAQSSLNPDLQGDKPWYQSAALAMAYADPSGDLWGAGPPTWASSFGPSGSLQYMATALVVVDGIDLTMTSGTAYTADQQKQWTAAASVGFWPFFSGSGGGGFTNRVDFDAQGKMTITSSAPVGNPTLLGVLVESMSQLFGGKAAQR